MGRVATGNRAYHVKRLTPLHYSILELVAFGYGNRQIAEALGVSRNTVSNVKNSEVARPVLEDMDSLLERATAQHAGTHDGNMLAAVAPVWKALRRAG
jgi:FixJ family two-component response regulator